MLKQTVLILTLGLLASHASFADSTKSIQQILAKDSVLKEADDFCVARIGVLYKAADKIPAKNQPKNYIPLSDALFDLGNGINEGIKSIAGTPKNTRATQAKTLRDYCEKRTNELRSIYLSKFNVIFDDEVSPKKDESLIDEFLDFLSRLLSND